MCLSDATPVYPEGEEWEVERENLRAGHPQEALAFGMLDLANAPAALPQTAWRFDPQSTILHRNIVIKVYRNTLGFPSDSPSLCCLHLGFLGSAALRDCCCDTACRQHKLLHLICNAVEG